jgi:hypothetical protein
MWRIEPFWVGSERNRATIELLPKYHFSFFLPQETKPG